MTRGGGLQISIAAASERRSAIENKRKYNEKINSVNSFGRNGGIGCSMHIHNRH